MSWKSVQQHIMTSDFAFKLLVRGNLRNKNVYTAHGTAQVVITIHSHYQTVPFLHSVHQY